jgi:hypothetical protein
MALTWEMEVEDDIQALRRIEILAILWQGLLKQAARKYEFESRLRWQ